MKVFRKFAKLKRCVTRDSVHSAVLAEIYYLSRIRNRSSRLRVLMEALWGP